MKTNSEMHTSPESCRGTVIYRRGFWNGFPSLLPDQKKPLFWQVISIRGTLPKGLLARLVPAHSEQISNFQGCGSIDHAIC